MNIAKSFEDFLRRHDEEAWNAALATLLRSIHEVDRNATRVWFSFYPLSLFKALEAAEDREQLAQQLLLQGDYELKDQIDSSHRFLYGHRFWPQVKQAVEGYAQQSDDSQKLADQILAVAKQVAAELKQDESLLVGITAVAFMTMQQAGLQAFEAAPGKVMIDKRHAKKSPVTFIQSVRWMTICLSLE